ncbi:hypothetical protein QJS10_CPB11g00834 [Acorus calamus]|uniref:RanBP2-type domain-containing protein n=1 Tax=Acorus calamus TaxID=4465 RepID=A0AAV9DTS9_ACOCL|nr:hypothetical protein QJS10_CPB11g00817 [Acorus calamus]KAK1305104.1 hypothetical protein QJS10_CPB11g00834 [Acorus calamus]
MVGGRDGEGREGDWDCMSCRNRNYAFRSLCNRCKQPRILVDANTPSDSKWFPRIGDWICSGCSNNNYASREKCKKCGQSKEEAEMPTIAVPGASLSTYANYYARAQGMLGLQMNLGISGNSALQQSLHLGSNWPFGPDRYRFQSASAWAFGGNTIGGFPFVSDANNLGPIPKGWRNGDWICNCGFHNYSSRAQCKKCNAPLPSNAPSSTTGSAVSDMFPTLGTKRLASEEFVGEWDNKRLHSGDIDGRFLHPYHGLGQDQSPGRYSTYPSGSSAATPTLEAYMQSQQSPAMPAILGKGAKKWRDGDWMCTNCNNHNYASRSYCNRCKTQKEGSSQPVSV